MFCKGSSRACPASVPAEPSARCLSIANTLSAYGTVASRPDLEEQLKQHYADVCASWKTSTQLPIVYDPSYNITLFGIEKLHPFDSCKFSKVAASLQSKHIIGSQKDLMCPLPISQAALLDVHTASYLQALHSSSLKVAQVTELAPLAVLPNFLVQRQVMNPMKMHVGGTVLAVGLAVVHGWAINLGGGMHHAHRQDGAGWCPYADITLAVRRIRAASAGAVQRVLVVDLDVHQGNGVERDKLHFKDSDMYIVDMYNSQAFPWDSPAKAAINCKVELQPGTSDEVYLANLQSALETAAAEFPKPHLVVYNAGTDILAGDPLGRLKVSAAAVQQRDAAVFAFAEQQQAPIAMLLSGGYTRASAGVIADSLTSLLTDLAKKLADCQ